MKSAIAVCLLAVLASACATPDAPAHADGHQRHDPGLDRPTPHPSLFVSPSGQPFRAAPGEPYPVARWFAQVDKNHDGRVDRNEFRADAEAFFHVLDDNHDGIVDGFEVTDYEQKIAPEIMGAYGSGGIGRGGGGHRRGSDRAQTGSGASSAAVLQGAAVFGLLDEPEPVAADDLDLSGRITLAEVLTMTDRRFDRLDVKHLGYLTLADLPKTPAQIMAEPKKRGQRDDAASRPAPQASDK